MFQRAYCAWNMSPSPVAQPPSATTASMEAKGRAKCGRARKRLTDIPYPARSPFAWAAASAVMFTIPRAVTLGTSTWMGLAMPSRMGPT